MSQRNLERAQVFAELEQHLTEAERAKFEEWKQENAPGEGSTSPEDWPGWCDVVIRHASRERSVSLETVSNVFYYAACGVAMLCMAFVFVSGLLTVLGVIDDGNESTAVINANLNGGAQVVFLLVIAHVLMKLVGRSFKRRTKLLP
nr:hypothetical protein 16.1 kDa [uncultured bacterium]